MIFRYGSYTHDQDEVMVRTSCQWLVDGFNRRMGEVLEYTIIGVKRVDDDPDPAVTQANLTDALFDLTEAYNSDYGDIELLQDDGATPTRHILYNEETFGGVKVVVPPSFMNGPWGGRVEYTNCRTYYIVLRAEIRVGEGLFSLKQKLTVRGTGGPKWRYSPKLVGSPDAQVLQTATSFWYVQEGEAVGRKEFAVPADVLFPGIEHGEMRLIEYTDAADRVIGEDGQNAEMFGTAWKYMMEATTAQGFSAFVVPAVTELS
jgi:hypothetical protein